MLKRLNIYFKEMYPLIPRLLLGFIVFGEIYFILLELQSKVDNMMPYRILEYMVEIWRKDRKNNKNKELPLIVPCVLYTGKSKWTKSSTQTSKISSVWATPQVGHVA